MNEQGVTQGGERDVDGAGVATGFRYPTEAILLSCIAWLTASEVVTRPLTISTNSLLLIVGCPGAGSPDTYNR